MKYFDSYHLPTTLDEALNLLTQYQGRARVIAGGTDLLLDLSSDYIDGQRPHYAALIDVTRLAGANEIRVEGKWIVIGCGVTHAQIVETVALHSTATALTEGCALIGGPQVRNVATLTGNVAHGLPAADGTIALLALGAEAQVAGYRSQDISDRLQGSGTVQVAGDKTVVIPETTTADATQSPAIMDAAVPIRNSQFSEWRPLSSLFLGPGQSAVDPSREIITAIRFRPTGKEEASAFARIMRPQGVALPILGMAARVKGFRIDDFRFQIDSVAISAGPVAPVPFRASQTEQYLQGKTLNPETLAEAQRILVEEARPRTSAHRATREYRYELLPTLLEQVLTRAVERAQVAG